jgi:hypothetical protein
MKRQKLVIEKRLRWFSKELVVQIDALTRRSRTDWHCWLNILVAPKKRVHHERVPGVESWDCIENAMNLAQRTIKSKFPEAFAFEQGDEGCFPFIVFQEIPEPYYKRLRDHLESERARMTQELFAEFKKSRRAKPTFNRKQGNAKGGEKASLTPT